MTWMYLSVRELAKGICAAVHNVVQMLQLTWAMMDRSGDVVDLSCKGRKTFSFSRQYEQCRMKRNYSTKKKVLNSLRDTLCGNTFG